MVAFNKANYDLLYLSKRNINQTRIDIEKDYCSKKTLQVREYPNAVVASRKSGGPGVFALDGYVKETDFTNCVAEERQLNDTPDIPTVDEEVVFIGTLYSVYGHVITDNLKHLWILLEPNHLQKLKFVYCWYRDKETIPEFFYQILELLGKSRDEVIKIEGAQRFRKVYVPDQCFFAVPGGKLEQSGDRFYTKEYVQIIDRIKETATHTDCDVPKKIYFTRTALNDNGHRDFGEHFIEATFRKMGYAIIAPEKIGFFEQVYMLKHCEEFAATQGSISLNAFFCDKDAHITLINKQNFNDPYQLAINQVRGGECTIIDANCSLLNRKKAPWSGPFFMYNSKELCRFASVEYGGFPKIEFAKYILVSAPGIVKGRLRQYKEYIKRFAYRFPFGRLFLKKCHKR